MRTSAGYDETAVNRPGTTDEDTDIVAIEVGPVQFVEYVAPANRVVVPAAQSVQFDEPAAAANDPTAHNVHWAPPTE
jgi:hypothetical protein